jgi:hypothetical protein
MILKIDTWGAAELRGKGAFTARHLTDQEKSIYTVPSISFLLFPQQHVICLSAVFQVNVLRILNCKFASNVRFMLSKFQSFVVFFFGGVGLRKIFISIKFRRIVYHMYYFLPLILSVTV